MEGEAAGTGGIYVAAPNLSSLPKSSRWIGYSSAISRSFLGDCAAAASPNVSVDQDRRSV